MFTYDSLYQLDTVDYNDGNELDFGYDSLFNRIDVEINSVTTDYTVDTNGMNQYSSVGADSFSYDNNGNLTDDGTYLYYYDCENRLIDVNDSSDNAIVSFAYDAFGRRVSKTVHDSPDVVTRYCYDGDQVIAEYDGSGSLLKIFIYGPGIDEPLMLYDASSATIYLYMYDRLGNVAGLLNYTTGALVERYEYDVFGKATVHTSAGNDGEWMTDDDVTSSTSSVGNPYMFTGRRYDSEIDKYYYRARYYDADTGRFLSPDPIGYYDSMNLYSYCWNNPTNWIDPYGFAGTTADKPQSLPIARDACKDLSTSYEKIFLDNSVGNFNPGPVHPTAWGKVKTFFAGALALLGQIGPFFGLADGDKVCDPDMEEPANNKYEHPNTNNIYDIRTMIRFGLNDIPPNPKDPSTWDLGSGKKHKDELSDAIKDLIGAIKKSG